MDEPVGVVAPSQRKWAVLATSTSTIISMVDQTIANAALPTIARNVNASASASIWVINGYQLGLMVGIVPFAALGDILGYWLVFRIGLIAFIVSSLGCCFSHDLLTLSVARFVQGLAGAALTSTAQPINRIIYPPNMVGSAAGYSAMAVALGAAAGPVIGGLILAVAPWPWLFALNVPIGLAALFLALKAIPKVPGHNHPFDALSAWQSVAMFGFAVFGFDAMGHTGATPLALGEVAIAGIAGWFFIRRQLAAPLPIFALGLFAQLRFSLAAFACYSSFVAQTVAYVALPFAFQSVMGHTPLQVGLLLLPWLLGAAVMAPISGPLADRYNSSSLAAIGLAIFSVGLLLATVMGSHPSPLDISWRMAICGIGYGLFQSPNNRALLNSVPRERSGAPQAIQGVARVLGQTTGALIVAMVFAVSGFAAGAGGISAGAIVVTMAIATAIAVVSALACLWRGIITGVIRLGPQVS